MKRLLILLVVGAFLVGSRCTPEVSPIIEPSEITEDAKQTRTPTVEPFPTEVVAEPSPTEEIEEPTATPVPPTPTPEPPTPTPEPTATPTPTPTPVPEYVGLPPAEVERLREKCLQENPDSLCLPLPVDPTQPGVEVFILQVRAKNSSKVYGILGIKAPAGTIFYAPFGGGYNLSYWCQRQRQGEALVCDESRGWPMLEMGGAFDLRLYYHLAESSMLTAADFLDPSIFERLIKDWRGIDLALGDVHFTLKTDDLAESPGAGLVLVSDPGVQVFSLFRGEDGLLSFDEDDLLKDEQGRIVYIKP